MNEINISYNHNFEFPLVKKNLKDYCRKVLDHNNYKSSLISLIFIDQEELREMKKLYFKEDAYTDVIAFNFNKNEEDLEGELYLSLQMIENNASNYSVTLESEIKRVVAHGLLHLIGYRDDNDRNKAKMTKMEDICIQLFHDIKILC
tara:strand:- start:3859 stop:4299 length:441 start_codon:yes stop_codon:yes gene_type:complete